MKHFAWIALGAATLVAGTTQAAEAEYNFKVFGGAAYVAPLSDTTIEGVADSVEASSAVGYELGLEWKPLGRFGFELSYLNATHDVEADGVKIAEIDLAPLSLTLNWHVINGDTFNWYVGPTVAFVDWGSLEGLDGSSTEVDSETTYGVSTGIDIGFGDHFALVGGLRWLDSSADTDAASVSVDPIFLRVGVAWRF